MTLFFKTDIVIIGYSTDGGITWTRSANDTAVFSSGYIRSITYSNGKFVAVGNSGHTGIIEYSTDGIIWTRSANDTAVFGGYIYSITYGNNKFVAGSSSSSRIVYSTDGVTWTRSANDTAVFGSSYSDSDIVYSIAYGNGKFVAGAGSYGKVEIILQEALAKLILLPNKTLTWEFVS